MTTLKFHLESQPAATIPPGLEHVHQRFEEVRRERRLAPELKCFDSDRELANLHFIANANSIHVVQWLKLFAHTGATVKIETANPSFEFSNECLSSHQILPNWTKGPMVLRYFLAGLRLRFSRKRDKSQWLHVHGASGNGLIAWLSGHPYVIGTYGSEIFGSNERGFLYRCLMTRILRGATRIQAASQECITILRDLYGIPEERLYCFHLGLDEKTFHGVDPEQRAQLRKQAEMPLDQPVWISNRRTHPHYRTADVVEGFLAFASQQPKGRLVLLSGEHDPEYTRQIQQMCAAHDQGHRVTIIERLLTHPQVAAWLQLADFAISVPKTDMLSVSTYQALGCGAVAILSDLKSYDPLRPCGPIHWMQQYEPGDFASMFKSTAETWPTSYEAQRKICLQFTRDRYSTENAVRDIAAFYLGHPLRAEGVSIWAA